MRGLDAGDRVGVSVNFLPLAVLAPENQCDPKCYFGGRLISDRRHRMLRADDLTQIAANAGSGDV
jgi:hypothetical protein